MKKKILLTFMLCLLFLSTVIFAADQGYEFGLNYKGEIIAGEAKAASVTLTGTEAVTYTNVRIKVDFISGPAKPTLIAYDSNGTEFNIAEIGYWGPDAGFAVGGTFTNETPITATYPQAGTYVTRLSLIDVANNNAVITSREFTITVTDPSSTLPEDSVVADNTIESIPQAGISWWVYVLVIAAVIIVAWAVIHYIQNKEN